MLRPKLCGWRLVEGHRLKCSSAVTVCNQLRPQVPETGFASAGQCDKACSTLSADYLKLRTAFLWAQPMIQTGTWFQLTSLLILVNYKVLTKLDYQYLNIFCLQPTLQGERLSSDTLNRCDAGPGPGLLRDMCRHLRAHLSLLRP